MKKEEVWLSELRLGQPRDVYTLSGTSETDPWALLHIDSNDIRIIAGQHTEWAATLFNLSPQNAPNATNLHECVDMVLPYDYALSTSYALGSDWNPCLAHGFVHPDTVTAWQGPTKNVQTRSKVLSVDDYGRITSARNDNDVFRGDDDVCIQTVFAVPLLPYPRVLSAPASQKVVDCDKHTVFASESFTYDGLAPGRVSLGRVTSHTVDRRVTTGPRLARSVGSMHSTMRQGMCRQFDHSAAATAARSASITMPSACFRYERRSPQPTFHQVPRL
jgi:hypothetical protein